MSKEAIQYSNTLNILKDICKFKNKYQIFFNQKKKPIMQIQSCKLKCTTRNI